MSLAVASSALAATPTPFDPDTAAVFIAQGAPDTQLDEAVESNGALTFEAVGPAAAFQYNAIAYDPATGYIYSVANTGGGAGDIIEIGQNGVLFNTGIAVSPSENVGVFGPNGDFYVGLDGDVNMDEVNLATKTVTPYHPTALQSADLTYAQGYFWGMDETHVERIDVATGQESYFTVPSSLFPGADSAAGAAWTYGNGNLGFSVNGNGDIYQIAVSDPGGNPPTFTLVSHQSGPPNDNNDGTAIPGEPVDLGITKTASPSSAAAGTQITFNLTVTNNGPGNSSGYQVTDTLPAGFTNVASSTPGCSVSGLVVTCNGNALNLGASATIAVTADTPSPFTSALTNTATVTGNEADPNPTNNTATATVSPDEPAVSITKEASVSPAIDTFGAKVGDLISYQYTVTNTGNEPLASVAVDDPSIGAVSCQPLPVGGLPVGASVTCMSDASHVVTQADVDAGEVVDTATATGTDSAGNVSPTSNTAMATVPTVSAMPSLSLSKTADAANGDDTPVTVGETIQYSYVVTNTGNVNMTSIAVSDPTAGAVTCDPLPAGGLAPGATVNCAATGSYTVTQSDVNAGGVTDTATASGLDPAGATVKSDPASKYVPSAPQPLVSIQKTATVTPSADQTAAKVGDTIAYTYVVTNIGNVTLGSVSVSDPTAGTVSCDALPAGGLVPGGTVDCAASVSHTVTQADVDAGSVVDTATATGMDTAGLTSPNSNPSTATVDTVSPVISDSIVKSATVTPGADQNAAQVGDTIQYSYVVTNTGNVDQPSVSVSDPSIGAVNCPTPTAPGLAPGASETCTAAGTYTVTQADVDAGSVVDSATATGTGPGGVVGPPSQPSKKTIDTVALAPTVSIQKSAAVVPAADQGAAQVGDQIFYSYVVTNTGNATLASVAVDDPTVGPVSCPTPAAPGLAPGASETCKAESPHVVTQADVDAGSVVDTATATGTDLTGTVSPTSPPSTATVDTVAEAPGLTVVKTAEASGGDSNPLTAGETIQYSYVLTNTGNVTLSSVGVSDVVTESARTTPLTATCPSSTLAPQQSETCTANSLYTVVVNGDTVSDSATGTGTDPTGQVVTDVGNLSLPTLTPAPAVMIDKTASTASPDDIQVGDPIDYSYVVTNTGNVTLQSVSVSDLTAGPVTCDALPVGGLPPGGTVDCAADNAVIVTQADVDAGSVTDMATATGDDTVDGLSATSPISIATVYSAPAPLVSVQKIATVTPAADQTAVQVGDTIAYTYTVTNVGNVDLPTVSVSDPSIGAVSCPTPSAPGLAPGASETCTANSTHTVTQADVDAGSIVDTATATGTDTLGTVSPPATGTATVPTVPADPMLSVRKVATVSPAADQGAVKVGDTVSYSFVITNTGNVDLASLDVSDPSLGAAVTCPVPASPGLAPGASETCTTSGTHTVTQTDLDAGGVSDEAFATGVDPGGQVTPIDPGVATLISSPAPAVSVVKTATVSPAADQTGVKLGDEIDYSYTVTNTGNTTLASVAVSDPSLGPVACPIPAPPGLTPGASETCLGEVPHVVSSADISAGQVSDSATATGTDLLGVTSNPSNPSTVTEPVATTPATTTTTTTTAPPTTTTTTTSPPPAGAALAIHKSVNHATAYPGEKLTYELTVTNTGPDPATRVKVVDRPDLAMTVLSVHTTQGTCTKKDPVTCELGTVEVGKTVRITITAVVKSAGTERNTATVTSGTKDLDPTHATSTATTKVRPVLKIKKTASVKIATPGQDITYTITITNPMPLSAHDVTACDELPAGLLYVSSDPKAMFTGRKSCWTLTALAAHHSVSYRIVANAEPGKGGVRKNTATVVAKGGIPATATATVTVTPAAPVPCTIASYRSRNTRGHTIIHKPAC